MKYIIKNNALAIATIAVILTATMIGCRPAHGQEISNNIPLVLKGATNWVAIPYVKYDIQDHTMGYGGALLYKVSPNFYTGARFDQLNGHQTTAGVQAQLQATFQVGGIEVTPFLETSVGLGSSSLYGSTGPGAFINLYSHQFTKAKLNIGIIGDYEHVINGDENYNTLNAGPVFNLSF